MSASYLRSGIFADIRYIFSKFPTWFSDSLHDQDVLIDNFTKETIIVMCDEARLLDNDSRFQSIITSVEDDINTYHNVPFSTIKNDFQ